MTANARRDDRVDLESQHRLGRSCQRDRPRPSDCRRVLLCRWWIVHRGRETSHSRRAMPEGSGRRGPVGFLRAMNTATHELAREGSRTPFTVWLRHRLYRRSYRKWVRRFDRLSKQDIRAIEKATAHLAYRPLLSVLMPVYNTDERWLRAAIASVAAQLYPHWELCIADDGSSTAAGRRSAAEIQRATHVSRSTSAR